jgi:hypothetical protein
MHLSTCQWCIWPALQIEGAAPAMLKAIELIGAVLRESPTTEMPGGAPASFKALAQSLGGC